VIFAAWQPAMLNRTAGFGQERTYPQGNSVKQNEMMQLNKIVIMASLLACIVTVAGCYEEGFEYQTKTTLDPVNASGVSGSAVMGYGIGLTQFRMRIALRGLSRNVEYQARFFDATGCSDRDLAHADRIDGVRNDFNKRKEVWGFDSEPVSLTGSFIGTVKKEFLVSPPTAPSIYVIQPDKYPTIVIYALVSQRSKAGPRLERVACGTISSIPTNQRPHT
jgi:hypothetical protein